MQVFLSGLSEQATLARFGHAAIDTLQWQPASLFLAEAEMAAADLQRQWVWLYRAPWVFLAEGNMQGSAAALHQWQAQQRAVLQLRRHLRQGLLLVNADRIQPQMLAERLGIAGNTVAEPSTLPPLSGVLAGMFEQLAPECWELYEALEAAAWLPVGSPEFRATRESVSIDALPTLIDLLTAGDRLPSVQKQLTDCRTEMQSMAKESELLLNQLHQVQEELEKHYLDNIALKEQLNSRVEELEASRKAVVHAEDACQKLVGDVQNLQRQLADSQTELQSATEESELLLDQLHQVQEELENYYLANREILNNMGQYEHTLNRARRVISQLASHA